MPPAPPVMSATLCVRGGQEARLQFVDWRNPNWCRRERGFGIEDMVFFLSGGGGLEDQEIGGGGGNDVVG